MGLIVNSTSKVASRGIDNVKPMLADSLSLEKFGLNSSQSFDMGSKTCPLVKDC